MTETISLSFNAIGGMTQQEFMDFCLDNPGLTMERAADGQIFIMSNTGGKTGDRNSELNMQLRLWNKSHRLGKVFDSSTSFRLASGAVRSPDAAWVALARWQALSEREQRQFPPLCPDFVIELLSESDTLKGLQAKLVEDWLGNGCRLAWLVDADAQTVYVYRPGAEVEVVQGFGQPLDGGEVLPGFSLDLNQLI
jgi:Uma2 family endonuclease